MNEQDIALVTEIARREIRDQMAWLNDADIAAIADRTSPYMWANIPIPALKKIKRGAPTRFLDESADINLDAAGVGVGHANPTLPDIVNLWGFATWLTSGDGRELNIRTGGGGADCMFDYLVSTCWATEVSAGRGTEGQQFTSLTGCTFLVYSTVKGAVDHIASASNTMAHPHVPVFVCPGTYTESTITWPTQGTSTAVSITFVGSAINNANATNPGTYITSSSGNLFTIASAPIEIAAKDISFSANGGNKIFAMDNAARVMNAHFVNCRFAENFDCGFTQGIFDNCYIDSTATWVPTGSAMPVESVHFINCIIAAGVDLSALASASEVVFIGNRFNGTAAKIQLGQADYTLIMGNTFLGGATTSDVILYTTNTGALLQTIITGNHFTVPPSTTNALIRIAPGAGGSAQEVIITNNTFPPMAGAVAATTAYIKLIGTSARKILGAVVANNAYGGTDPAFYIEDRGGFSVIGDYCDHGTFGPDSPAAQALYNLTNYTLPRVNGVIWGSGAPTHTDNYGAWYKDTATDTIYTQQTDPTGNTWAIFGTSGGGASAPVGEAYVTIGNTGNLSAERALTAGTGIDITDGGANSTVTIDVDVTELNIKQSILLTAAGGAPTTTSPCSDPTKVEAGTNDVDYWVLDFDQTTDEFAFWGPIILPDNYDGGTFTAKFCWTAASGSGTVVWGIQLASRADDEAIDQAYGTAVETSDTLLATGDVHISAESSAITAAGTPAAGELLFIRVYRDPDDDTLNADARLIGVRLEYTTAGLGV